MGIHTCVHDEAVPPQSDELAHFSVLVKQASNSMADFEDQGNRRRSGGRGGGDGGGPDGGGGGRGDREGGGGNQGNVEALEGLPKYTDEGER